MYLSGKDFKKYFIFFLLFIWFVLLSHLFYVYLKKNGENKPVKGGVLIESIIKGENNNIVNPIPYLGNNYYSKYIQSLLFRGCLNSFGSGDLCDVTTNDYKTFVVTLSGDNYWSDGRKITLDDVYFTYNNIIFQNTFNLTYPIANNISNIEKEKDKLKIIFSSASINNKSLFKNYILPSHLLKGKNKKTITNFLGNLVNSTCIKLDLKSDYIKNIILDYTNCSGYYISKYQFVIVNNIKDVYKLFSSNKKVDLYTAYENIDDKIFNKYKIKLNKRYAIFWNVRRPINTEVKTYLSHKILKELKNNLDISNKIEFNGYGLFVLPKINIGSGTLKEYFSKGLINKKNQEFYNSLILIKDKINYKFANNKKYFIKNKLDGYLTIYGDIGTGKYSKIGISSNGKKEYFPKSFNGKTFKYIISEKFKNIKEGKNSYTIYAYTGNNKIKLDNIELFYKKVVYPKFDIKIPSLTILYVNKGFIGNLGDAISKILEKLYPSDVIVKKVDEKGYNTEIQKGNYDLVISDINFDGKDISPIFKTNDSLSNPSNFVNPNFASLINQDLLSPKKFKGKIFSELNKIYQENIPVVFIGNKKTYLFINRKYNPQKLDYSYFDNKKKFVKSVIINKIKSANIKEISIKGFVNFLKKTAEDKK